MEPRAPSAQSAGQREPCIAHFSDPSFRLLPSVQVQPLCSLRALLFNSGLENGTFWYENEKRSNFGSSASATSNKQNGTTVPNPPGFNRLPPHHHSSAHERLWIQPHGFTRLAVLIVLLDSNLFAPSFPLRPSVQPQSLCLLRALLFKFRTAHSLRKMAPPLLRQHRSQKSD